MSIADRIRRIAPDLTVRELARRAHLPRTTVAGVLQADRSTSRWAQDRGKRGPTLDTVVALAQALNVSPAFLAFGGQSEAGGGE